MMLEGCLIPNHNHDILYWRLPKNRSSVYIPDSLEFAQWLFKNKDTIAGTAHSHPGKGIPFPSHEDITTYSSIELGNGKIYTHWITSENEVIEIKWIGPDRYDYEIVLLSDTSHLKWLEQLRNASYNLKERGEKNE